MTAYAMNSIKLPEQVSSYEYPESCNKRVTTFELREILLNDPPIHTNCIQKLEEGNRVTSSLLESVTTDADSSSLLRRIRLRLLITLPAHASQGQIPLRPAESASLTPSQEDMDTAIYVNRSKANKGGGEATTLPKIRLALTVLGRHPTLKQSF